MFFKMRLAARHSISSSPLTGVCLVVAVGLTQDLTLILLTKKHQTKQNKKQTNKNSSTTNINGEGFIVKNIYAVCYC